MVVYNVINQIRSNCPGSTGKIHGFNDGLVFTGRVLGCRWRQGGDSKIGPSAVLKRNLLRIYVALITFRISIPPGDLGPRAESRYRLFDFVAMKILRIILNLDPETASLTNVKRR